MTNEKPAPTAAEIAEARNIMRALSWCAGRWDRDAKLVGNASAGQIVDSIRTLLAALDAAEARATAEYQRGWDANVEAAREIVTRAETAERERDELRDALKLYEAFPELATGDTARRDEQRAAYNGLRWVLGLLAGLDDGRQDSVAKAFRPVVEKIKRERDEARAALKPGAIVVSDTEEARERIARALWDGEGYSEPWGESARNSHPVTYRCVLRDTDAVLATLREPRP